MSCDSPSSAKKLNFDKASNFMRQFRDPDSRELKKLSANQFMEVWSHYDGDGNGYIEGTELDGFLREFVSSANFTDISPDMKTFSRLLFLAVLVVACSSAFLPQSSLITVGSVRPGAELLLWRSFAVSPVPDTTNTQDFVYRGGANTIITAVHVVQWDLEREQRANATIVLGGIGRNNVNIRMQSSFGQGYNISVSIWGQA